MKKKIFCIIILVLMILSSTMLNVTAKTTDEDTDIEQNYYDEEIVKYDINIDVNEDGSMHVIENITVNVIGYQIKHGIYRDFPTQYKNKTVKFKVNDVKMDGAYVNYAINSIYRGQRIKIGSSEDIVPQGLHTYMIDYTTDRQMFYEKDYDELYWNLVGSGWLFDIDKCTATINYPSNVKFLKDDIKTFVGAYGNDEEATNVRYKVDEKNHSIYFETKDKIYSNEAFTIVVRTEKGGLTEPDFQKKLNWFITDNITYIIVCIGLVALIVFQFFTWAKYGKDPMKNVIIPKYYPPEGMDSADVKYVDTMGGTERALEATIINLAVKGFLKFEKGITKTDAMKIQKISTPEVLEKVNELSPFEQKVYNKLSNVETLEYSSFFQVKLESLKLSMKDELYEKYNNKLFFKNTAKTIFSIFATVLLWIVAAIVGLGVNPYSNGEDVAGVFLALAICVMIGVFGGIVKSTIKTKASYGIVKIIFVLLVIAPFLISFGEMMFSTGSLISTSFSKAMIFIASVVDNAIYWKLIRRYSEEGARIKEDIEGFRMFIKVAKDDDFPNKTPEMFDKYFSYAYVLGLENKWADKFENVLKEANYKPSWCYDNMFYNGRFNATTFTSSFSSSFSSGMSAAATAPSSSYSSSGGGFSGGGSSGGGFSGGGGGGRRPEAAGKNLIFLALSY